MAQSRSVRLRQQILDDGPGLRRAILMGMVAVIPLVVVRAVNDPINVPKLALLMTGTTVVAGIRGLEILQGADWRGLKRLWIPAAAIGIPLLLAWIFSPYREWALFGEYKRFQGLIPYIALIAFGLLIADAFVGHVRKLAWAVAAGAGILGALAVLQWLKLDPFPQYTGSFRPGGAVGTLGNENFTGGFLAISLPIAIALMLLEKERRKLLAAIVTVIAGGLIVSFSQGPYAAAVAGVALGGGFALHGKIRWARGIGIVAAAAVALVVIASAFLVLLAPERSAILPLSVRLRGYWWLSATEMGLERPIVGFGPNMFGAVGVQFRSLQEALISGFEFPDDPHSVLFSMLANAGILGVIGFIALLAWIFMRARGMESGNLLQAGFLGALVAYFVQSLASIDEVTLRLLFWGVLGGFAASLVPVAEEAQHRKPARKRDRPGVFRRPLPSAAVALLSLGVLVWVGGFVRADAQVLHARRLANQGDIHRAITETRDALQFRDEYDYRHLTGFAIGDGVLELAIPGRKEFREVDELFSYVEWFPDLPAARDHARLREAHANKLASLGEDNSEAREQAAERYMRSLRLDPVLPQLRKEAAALLLELQRYDQVDQVLTSYVHHVFAEDAVIWGLIAVARARDGEEAAARAAIERALALDPNQSSALEAQRLLAGEKTG